jgi:hypothetical protein
VLGRGVTVSWLNDLLGHDMTVSTLEAGPATVSFSENNRATEELAFSNVRKLQHFRKSLHLSDLVSLRPSDDEYSSQDVA